MIQVKSIISIHEKLFVNIFFFFSNCKKKKSVDTFHNFFGGKFLFFIHLISKSSDYIYLITEVRAKAIPDQAFRDCMLSNLMVCWEFISFRMQISLKVLALFKIMTCPELNELALMDTYLCDLYPINILVAYVLSFIVND